MSKTLLRLTISDNLRRKSSFFSDAKGVTRVTTARSHKYTSRAALFIVLRSHTMKIPITPSGNMSHVHTKENRNKQVQGFIFMDFM